MWQNKEAFNKDVTDTNWWWGKARMEIVSDSIKDIKAKNILEIGAGYGGMTKMLSSFGNVKAIEPDDEAAKYLKDNLGIDTYHGTFESFSEIEKYDLVTCFDVLEHIKNDKEALFKMESLINDKGALIITVPAYMFLWSKHDEVNYHYRRYTQNGLISKLPKSLVIKRISYFNTLLFPMAVIDKLFLSKENRSYSLAPNILINEILYRIFVMEKNILRNYNFPFGISIMLIAEKSG